MRRVHQAYDDDDLYDYDDYDEDEYYDEEEEQAMLAQQYAYEESRQSAAAIEQQSAKEEAYFGTAKKGSSKEQTTASKEEQADKSRKILEISQIIPGSTKEKIKTALENANGDVNRAVEDLLAQISLESSKATDDSASRPVIVSIASEKGRSAVSPPVAPKPKPPAAKQAPIPSTKSKNKTKISTEEQARTKERLLTHSSVKKYKAGQPRAKVEYILKSLKEQGITEDPDADEKPNVNLVVVGHVDAGKSTLMGHLLYLLKYVSQRDMHKFEKQSKEIGKGSFAFAWVLDEHEEERERGVTVDVGVKHFETEHRSVTLLDAPGHRDFIPNMITGAVQGDVAILVVPANPGEFESTFERNGQTKEHALLVRFCGIRRLIIAVNKMDICGWSQERFDEIVENMRTFLLQGGYAEQNLAFVPVSGLSGENLLNRLPEGRGSWYKGPSLCEVIDGVDPARRPVEKPLRMVVADMYKTLTLGSITVSGKIEAGVIKEGQSVMIAPSNQLAKIKAIQRHKGKEVHAAKYAKAGENVDVGISGIEENMIGVSSIICDSKQPVPVLSNFVVEVTTFNQLAVPILNGTKVTLHIQSVNIPAVITKLVSVHQGDGKVPKENPRFIRKNQIATMHIQTEHPICVERFDDYRPLARVMLRQEGVTIAAGRVVELLQ